MKYSAIVEKLYFNDKKYVTRTELIEYCKSLQLNYRDAISYLIHNRYVKTILKGVFYTLSADERKHKSIDTTYLELIKNALELKGIKNWYFGLESAFKFNNITHEYFSIDYIINDKIFGKEPIEINGRKIKFVKIKPDLFGFGIIKNNLIYSDLEKTILDKIYLLSYAGNNYNEIRDNIVEYMENADSKKLLKYSKAYPKTVKKIMGGLLNDK
ncbi:MAG: hypothetical protein COT55_01775 [Candidatus Diapherotrites archaeon CG09_land_8_20_14_0_10_32_12]|nr:MAG: hypothetical protein COT55_01775 [Candidatus Diapherotrites archaeon CG09_land_8_20_14_0_10_32_12]